MSGSVHPDFDRDSGTIKLTDLLASVSWDRVAVVDLPANHTLYLREVRDSFVGLRTNANGALCWYRALDDGRVKRLARKAVENGGGVTLDSHDDAWPSRYADLPAGLEVGRDD